MENTKSIINIIDEIISFYVPEGNPEIWLNKIKSLRDSIQVENIDNENEKLNFINKPKEPIFLNEDFYYMIGSGGWISPEKYLESNDAKKVQDAINLIEQYREQGCENEWFEEE